MESYRGRLWLKSDEACSATARRRAPSTVAPHEPLVAQWLREVPDLSGAKILRRVRLAGYRGGKSALYELVRRLRVGRAAEVTVAIESPRRPGSVQGTANRCSARCDKLA